MLRKSRHKLLVFLSLVLVFAPVQSAISAIEMLGHDAAGTMQHCQMDMADHAGMDATSHDTCCNHDGACQDNCSACAQCVSVHAVIFSPTQQPDRPITLFISQPLPLFEGIPPGGEFRPPRLHT